MPKIIDLTGKTFGRLTVIQRSNQKRYVNGEILWECICSCSKKTKVLAVGSQLRTGHKKSCGCIWKPNKEEHVEKIKKRLFDNSTWVNGCLEWTGFKCKDGYGNICISENGIEKNCRAHRIMWMVHNGKIPFGYQVCHHCDNPSCINIEHLFLGSSKDNMDDMIRKGRQNIPVGEKRKNSKLKDEQVREILALKYKNVSSHLLCRQYGVAASTIRQIWARRSWKHINI